MADNKQSKTQIRSLRKGIIIFALLLASIVAIGIYLWQQSQALNQEYDRIENVWLTE